MTDYDPTYWKLPNDSTDVGWTFMRLVDATIADAMMTRAETLEHHYASAVERWEAEHGPSVFWLVLGDGAVDYEPPGWQRVNAWSFELTVLDPEPNDWRDVTILGPEISVLWARPRRWWSLADRRSRRLVREVLP